MNQKRILSFLRQVMANNNREWFQEHKKEYEAVRAEFERGVSSLMTASKYYSRQKWEVKVLICNFVIRWLTMIFHGTQWSLNSV